jgi:hypothetical protein
MLRSLLIAFLSVSSPAIAQIFAPVDDTPTVAERCDILCRKVYGDELEKLALCQEGCDEAERCTEGCAERFPADEEKRGRCAYLCARSR